jgi:hypothetical protein
MTIMQDLKVSDMVVSSYKRGNAMTAVKRPKPVHQMTIAQFEATFPDEEACRTHLVARRWPNGVYCYNRRFNDDIFSTAIEGC